MKLHEVGFFLVLGIATPFYTDSYLLWFHEREIKALAEYDECKKNGTKPTELMRYANNARRWNRASLCLIVVGFVWVAVTIPVGA